MLTLPNTSQQIYIAGQNGSGKTSFALWKVSRDPFDKMPYVLVDYKGEDLFRKLRHVVRIGLNEVPRHPGLYHIRPRIDQDDDAFINWCRHVHRRGRVGLIFDEGYMLPRAKIIDALYTQGRSLHIPITTLTQRPLRIKTPFAVSEAHFHAIFYLSDIKDKERLRGFVQGIALDTTLPAHCCWYQQPDPGNKTTKQLFQLDPVPHPDEIVERINERLTPRRRAL